MQEQEVIKTGELARRMGLCVDTIRRMARLGRITGHRVTPKLWMFEWPAVRDELLNGKDRPDG